MRKEIIGNSTLYLGDCKDVIQTIGLVDAVVSDPPYGVLSQSGSAATRRPAGNVNNGRMSWDIAPEESLMNFLRVISAHQMYWGGCHLPLPATVGYLVWDKQIDGLNFGECEFCWTSLKFAPRIFRYRAVGVDGGKQHPTQKPIQLMKWSLGFLPKESANILDPFMGSGTTGIACQKLGKSFIGIEKDPEYFDLACRRIEEESKQGDLFLGDGCLPPKQEILL